MARAAAVAAAEAPLEELVLLPLLLLLLLLLLVCFLRGIGTGADTSAISRRIAAKETQTTYMPACYSAASSRTSQEWW